MFFFLVSIYHCLLLTHYKNIYCDVWDVSRFSNNIEGVSPPCKLKPIHEICDKSTICSILTRTAPKKKRDLRAKQQSWARIYLFMWKHDIFVKIPLHRFDICFKSDPLMFLGIELESNSLQILMIPSLNYDINTPSLYFPSSFHYQQLSCMVLEKKQQLD